MTLARYRLYPWNPQDAAWDPPSSVLASGSASAQIEAQRRYPRAVVRVCRVLRQSELRDLDSAVGASASPLRTAPHNGRLTP